MARAIGELFAVWLIVDLRTAPAFLPVLSLAIGVATAPGLLEPRILPAAALLACSAALGGRIGRLSAWWAAGLLVWWARQPASAPDPPSEHLPVTLVCRLASPWREGRGTITAVVKAERLRQGAAVRVWREKVSIALPSESPRPEGSRYRLRGFLRRSPGSANGGRDQLGPWRLTVKSGRLLVVVDDRLRDPLLRLSRRLRDRLRGRLLTLGRASPGVAMTRALVLGDREALSPSWLRGLRRFGLSHLVALSGLHVGLMIAVGLLVGARLPRPARLALVLAMTTTYLLLAGPRPGLLRASAMAGSAMAAGLLRRPPQALNSLACVAGALLVFQPELVDDVGFGLTVSATAGLLLIGHQPSAPRSAAGMRLPGPVAASVGAQLATLPWAVSVFHLVAPLAPLWNLAAIPWTGLLLLCAFLACLLAFVWEPGAALLVPILDLLAGPFTALAAVPPGLSPTAAVELGWTTGAALAALLTLAALRPRPWLPVAVSLLALWWLASLDRPEIEAVVLDVGQGDAILLRDRSAAALFDGGGWQNDGIATRVLLPALARLGVGRLHAAVLTHPDRDHCGGLVELASYLPVEEVWTVPGWRGSECVRALLTLPGVAVRPLWAGEHARLGRWRLLVLHPAPGARRGRNERSLVVLATVGRRRVLLTGDLERAGEGTLLRTAAGAIRAVDVLKVAHHGSRTSTSDRWLEVTRPRLALISAGVGNRYDHPATEVLERLRRSGSRVLRTDLQGMIRIDLTPDSPLRIELPGSPRTRAAAPRRSAGGRR